MTIQFKCLQRWKKWKKRSHHTELYDDEPCKDASVHPKLPVPMCDGKLAGGGWIFAWGYCLMGLLHMQWLSCKRMWSYLINLVLMFILSRAIHCGVNNHRIDRGAISSSGLMALRWLTSASSILLSCGARFHTWGSSVGFHHPQTMHRWWRRRRMRWHQNASKTLLCESRDPVVVDYNGDVAEFRCHNDIEVSNPTFALKHCFAVFTLTVDY